MTCRKTHKYTLFTAILILVIVMITGCSGPESQPDPEVKNVTDCVGREVEIPFHITKAACIDSFSGEVMVMAGAGEQMVCCPNGIKTDTILQQIYPDLENVSVVQSSGTINAEALLELDPDVIFLKNSFYITSAELEKIEKTMIPYLVVKYENMEEQINAIRLIGDVIGEPASLKAGTMADYYSDTVDLVKAKAKEIPENKKKTVYHSINGVTRTDGETSLGADWIRAVGCKNVSVGEKLLREGDIFTAGTEQIFVWDPDVLICNDPNVTDFFRNGDTFSGLRAVRTDQVYTIPIGATRWGQQGSTETFFAMLWLGTTLYPEEYKDVDLKQEVFNFYSDILNIDLTDEQYNKMIEGKGIRDASQNSMKR